MGRAKRWGCFYYSYRKASRQAPLPPHTHRIQMASTCVRYQENAGADYSQGRARCPVPAHGPHQPCNSAEEKLSPAHFPRFRVVD